MNIDEIMEKFNEWCELTDIDTGKKVTMFNKKEVSFIERFMRQAIQSAVKEAKKEGYEEGLNLRLAYNDPKLIKQFTKKAVEEALESTRLEKKDCVFKREMKNLEIRDVERYESAYNEAVGDQDKKIEKYLKTINNFYF